MVLKYSKAILAEILIKFGKKYYQILLPIENILK